MIEDRETQVDVLNEVKDRLRQEEISTYSVLLQMSREAHGTAVAVCCTLDTRQAGTTEKALIIEQQAQTVIQDLCKRHGLELHIVSTGHAHTQPSKKQSWWQKGLQWLENLRSPWQKRS